jgi:hypothetical protein
VSTSCLLHFTSHFWPLLPVPTPSSAINCLYASLLPPQPSPQVVQLLLTFWRNLLTIPDPPAPAVVAGRRASPQVGPGGGGSCLGLLWLMGGAGASGVG